MPESKTDKILNIATKRGFFFPSGEIYNAKAGFWTYGHLGTIYKAANFRHYGSTISAPRHSESTDKDQDGHVLECWIKDLKIPRWTYEPTQLSLWE